MLKDSSDKWVFWAVANALTHMLLIHKSFIKYKSKMNPYRVSLNLQVFTKNKQIVII